MLNIKRLVKFKTGDSNVNNSFDALDISLDFCLFSFIIIGWYLTYDLNKLLASTTLRKLKNCSTACAKNKSYSDGSPKFMCISMSI